LAQCAASSKLHYSSPLEHGVLAENAQRLQRQVDSIRKVLMGLESSSDGKMARNDSPRAGRKESVTRRLFFSSRRVAINQGLGILCAFGLQAFLSRVSGAAQLGAYTLFTSWIGILSALTVPGLEGTLVYFLPRHENDLRSRNKVVLLCLFAVCAISVSFAVAILGVNQRVFLWVGIPPGTRVVFGCSLVVFSIGKLLDAVFLGMGDAPLIGYFNIVRTVLRVVLCLPLLSHPSKPWNVVFIAVAVEGCLTVAFRFLKIRKLYPGILTFEQGFHRNLPLSGKDILAISLPMFGIGLIDTVYPFLDKAILGTMVSLDKIGIYRVSDSLAALNSVFVYPFIAFWPFISKLYTEDRLDELRGAYKNITLVIIAAMLPFSLALIELSGFGLSLFGREFAANGRTVLVILAFGTMVDAIAGPAGAVLKMTKHSRLSFVINLVLLLAYMGLGIALTQRFGLLGAAVAKATLTILNNGINVLANYLLIDIFPYTIKHALLLAWGGLILLARYTLPIPAMGVPGHFVTAGCQAALFLLLAVPLLRTQIQSYFRGKLPLPGNDVKGEA
jgi:O-antigen/teichoic acid export membrane protein